MVSALTHSILENQLYLTWSKWNMDEIFGLKYHLTCVHMPFFFEIPPSANHVIFITEFVILSTNPPLYEVYQLI